MTIGIVGRKAGMTRIFQDDGVSVPVTVISVEPNRVTQVKTLEADGYRALQVTTGRRRASRVTRPQAGHYARAGTEAATGSISRGTRLLPAAATASSTEFTRTACTPSTDTSLL